MMTYFMLEIILRLSLNTTHFPIKDFKEHHVLRDNMRKWLLQCHQLPYENSIGVDVTCFGDWISFHHLRQTVCQYLMQQEDSCAIGLIRLQNRIFSLKFQQQTSATIISTKYTRVKNIKKCNEMKGQQISKKKVGMIA